MYSFGHMIYEMTFGRPCSSPTCDSFPAPCPPELRSVLEALLSAEACKNGLPSVANLLMHPFFQNVAPANGSTAKLALRVPSSLRDALKMARSLTEKRLQEDQKQLRQHTKLSKAQARLSQDDDRKKRLLELRKTESSRTQARSSTSTRAEATSVKTQTPPPPPPPPPPISPPPPPPPPAPPTPGSGSSGSSTDRSALLCSIMSFNKGALRRTTTKDCSKPKL